MATKHILDLIPDIYKMVGDKKNWFDNGIGTEFSKELSLRLEDNLATRERVPALRLSQMGPRCPRQLWASIHATAYEEQPEPWARIKFSYGHILEALVIAMAKAAGHEVTGEQDELLVDGVVGHRDCVIDGCIVDVKSASSRSFQKFKDRSIGQSDTFGYLDQLDGYLVGSADDDLVRVKDRAYLLAIDKTLGHMVLYDHRLREESIRTRIRSYKEIVAESNAPQCTCGTVPDGKSGNIKLDVRASYSSYKHFCFPYLRTFLYASGPTFLTKVVRKPDVPEIDKTGKILYN
jgi:hypothetical protein